MIDIVMILNSMISLRICVCRRQKMNVPAQEETPFGQSLIYIRITTPIYIPPSRALAHPSVITFL